MKRGCQRFLEGKNRELILIGTEFQLGKIKITSRDGWCIC